MSRSSLRRLGLVALTLVTAFVGLSVPAAAEDTTGTITGQFTRDGQPVTPGFVVVFAHGDAVAFLDLDGEGRFTATDLPPDSYRVAFDDLTTGIRQFARQKLSFGDADVFEVSAGQTVVINEETLPTGTISGRLTQSDGVTPGSAEVLVHLASDNFSPLARTFTDADGRWRLDVPAADYNVSFQVPAGDAFATQWARQKVSGSSADVFTVAVGQTTIVDESLLPIGSISGRFTGSDGQPIVGGNVNLSDPAGNFVAHADTDDAGGYAFPALLAASYIIEFATPDFGRIQYARGKTTRETADAIVVAGGQNTVVDEQLLAAGAIRVRARDASTGALVRNVCVLVGELSSCDNGSGVVLIENVPPGQQFVLVESRDGRYFNADAEVTVAPAQTVELTVRMRRGATIDTKIVDRVTGEPVAGVCVELTRFDRFSLGNNQMFCADQSGVLHIGAIDPGKFRLFATDPDGIYGRQWVGLNGGTGRFEGARVVKAVTGKVVTIPAIRMDRAGAVEGVVTGSSGEPLFLAGIRLAPMHPGVGGGIGVETDEQGRYRFDGLGPYEWPLLVTGFEHASQWSGGVANHLLATGVRVRSGQITAFDVNLTKGTTISGTVRTAAGAPLDDALVMPHNLVTGDIMGGTFSTNGQYTVHVLGPQLVRILVQGGAGDVFYNHWYVNAADFDHATPIAVPAEGSKTINITVSRTLD